LYIVSQTTPSLLTPQALLLTVAAASALLASLLMLTQRSLKRLLILSTVEDVGFLFLGLAAASTLSYSGVLLAAASHALAKALLFTCLSAPEADGALDGQHIGLAVRYPVSAFGFLFGMLAMLGVPPTLGYLGRWRLYESALQISPYLLAAFIVSSVFALIAYVLALTHIWWGPMHDPHPAPSPPHPMTEPRVEKLPAGEPFVLQAVIVVLVALLLVAGTWPNTFAMLQWGRP